LEQRAKVLEKIDTVNIDKQLDSLLSGEIVGHDIELTTARLASTDFSTMDSVVRLLDAGSDSLDDTMEKLKEAVGPISEEARAPPPKALGPTASQILMPSPAFPKKETSLQDSSTSSTPVHLAGPPPTTLPVSSRKKQEKTKAATAAQQRSRSALVTSNNSVE